jgi:hypothetical protein
MRFFVQLCTVCFMMLDGQKAFCNNVYQYIRLYQHLPAFSTPVWFHRGVVAWGNPAFGGDLGAARPLLQNVAKL